MERFYILPTYILGFIGETCGHRIGVSVDDAFFPGEIELPVKDPRAFLELARNKMNETYTIKGKDTYQATLHDVLTTLTQLREATNMTPSVSDF